MECIITFWSGRDIIIVIVVVGFWASEERAKSKDLVNRRRGWFSVSGITLKPVWRYGWRRRTVVVATLFCKQYEEPLIQAQGTHPNKYLFGVEIAEWFFFSVSIPNIIHVIVYSGDNWVGMKKVESLILDVILLLLLLLVLETKKLRQTIPTLQLQF